MRRRRRSYRTRYRSSRSRRASPSRYKKRIRRERPPKAEVKYVDLQGNNLPMSVYDTRTATVTSRYSTCLGTVPGRGNKVVTNIFRFILPGVLAGQRVGSKIFVKSISTHITYRYCPNTSFINGFSDGAAAVIPAGNNLSMRMVWSDDTSPFNLDTEYFFHPSVVGTSQYTIASVKRLNRRRYKFWSDTTHKPGGDQTPIAAPLAVTSLGPTDLSFFYPGHTFKHNLKVNKNITYRYDQQVKQNTEDIYSLAVFATPPSLNGFNQQYLTDQYFCYSYNIRIYYTDA